MYRYPRATVVVPFPKCLSIVKKLVHSCLGDTRSSSRSPCFFSFCSVHQNSNMVDVLIEHMALLTREQEPLHVRRKSEILRKITWCWEWRRRQSPLYSSLANRIIVQSCHHTRLIDDSLCRPHSTTRLWKPKYAGHHHLLLEESHRKTLVKPSWLHIKNVWHLIYQWIIYVMRCTVYYGIKKSL